MPRTFTPGHRPSQPLYPDDLIYTTTELVADYLQLPLPDPVVLAGNSAIDGGSIKFPITGANYRRWGFEVADSILVYDDAVALGTTYTIASIASVGSSGQIYLVCTGSGSFTTANNAYVQNQSAFTNSGERGIKKSHVKNLISNRQDYIDTVTRHAWRPRIVAEEYLNFTTFKPFRRRYYTDYVGAVFVKHGAIQQVLKMGAWQGDYYREMACARVGLKVSDHTLLSGASVILCPGANGTATLTDGTASINWRAEFDHKSTADNLAALVNLDPEFNKAAIAIGSLTSETPTSSTAALNVHHEFLAVGNSDMGDGVVEISSMRSTEGGANATIAVTHNTGLTYVGNLHTAVSSTVSELVGNPATITLVGGGTGYSTGTGVATTGGTGTGLTVDVTQVGGVITVLAINAAGTGYTTGDTITVSTGGADATFTIATVTTITGFVVADGSTFVNGHAVVYLSDGTTNRVALCSRVGNIFTIVTDMVNSFAANVAIAILDSDQNITNAEDAEILQIRFKCDINDEERQKSWWSIEENGMILFNNEYPFFENHSLRMAYIYGERYVEKSISEACTKLVVMDIIMSDDYSVLFPEGTQNIDLSNKHQKLEAEVQKLLVPFQESIIVAGMGG
tara:strand:- start:4004 stop:5875 length:1872 start_codon:yes stop_codon:yes gene_type:complete